MQYKTPGRIVRYIHLSCVIVLVSTSLVACKAATPASNQTSPGIGLDITSTNCPSSIVKADDQVTWTNKDRSEHVVHAESSNVGVLFDSGVLQPDDTFSFIFTETGTYTYRCSADEAINGTITVE
jgi:plastocyanin